MYKFILILGKFFLKYKGGQIEPHPPPPPPPPEKNALKSPALSGLRISHLRIETIFEDMSHVQLVTFSSLFCNTCL